jgi:hypothetical protein
MELLKRDKLITYKSKIVKISRSKVSDMNSAIIFNFKKQGGISWTKRGN